MSFIANDRERESEQNDREKKEIQREKEDDRTALTEYYTPKKEQTIFVDEDVTPLSAFVSFSFTRYFWVKTNVIPFGFLFSIHKNNASPK